MRSDDKKRARLNCIAHLLSLIPYEEVPRKKVKLPKRSNKDKYDDQATLEGRKFVPIYARVIKLRKIWLNTKLQE